MIVGGAGESIALIDGRTGESLTYAQLAARVGAAASALTRPGAVVFLFAGNDLDSIVTWLAALTAGAPVALVDRRLAREHAQALVARYRPTHVFGRDDVAPTGGGPRPHGDLALLLPTSGSTGSPRLVRLSRRAVESNARSIASALALTPRDVAPTSLPIHYSFGLSVVTSHLAAGAAVIVTDDGLVSEQFWRACRTHGATSLAGVPYSYQLLRRVEVARLAPPTLVTLTQAGGRLDPAAIAHFHGIAAARGGGLYTMYGQTEATARIAVLPPRELPTHAGAVGYAVPGGSIAIGADDEILYRGPNVMMGYAESDADLARGDELAGVLRTGDRGRLDADGRLWITGRSRRIAKVFGVRMELDELEAMARDVAAGAAVAAVADGDRVRLFVETDGDVTGVAAALAARTGVHVSGFAVVAVSVLPRLASGKPDYPALEARR